MSSVDSAPEAEAELQAEEGLAGGSGESDEEFEKEVGALERAKPGTFIIWNNGYFSLTNNTNYDNDVLGVLTRWAQDGEMGTKELTERFRILRFDMDEAMPFITYSVLQA